MVPWRREPGAEEKLRLLFRRVVQLDAEAPEGARLTKQQIVERLRAVRRERSPPALCRSLSISSSLSISTLSISSS